MSWPDLINASLTMSGAVLVLFSIRHTFKHKLVRGVSLLTIGLYWLRSAWHFYYYLHLSQPISASASGAATVLETVWIGLMLYYVHKERQ